MYCHIIAKLLIEQYVLTLQRRNEISPRNASCRNFLLWILIFKQLIARRLYKSFGVKGLTFAVISVK
jgi:hypothetical protein